jgi:predicted secreted protein
MKTEFFKLSGRASCPDHGESLGAALAKAAQDREDACRAASPNVDYWCNVVAELLHLAADAYEAGAAASIGHNRAGRYEAAARGHRAHAVELLEEGKRLHDDKESARLLAAFTEGYEGRDIGRYSFDDREAAFIGQKFAREGRAMPSRINKVYEPRPLTRTSARDYLLVDAERFVVHYPDGRVDAATVQITAL